MKELLYYIALAKPKASHTWLPLPGVICSPTAGACKCVEKATAELPAYVGQLSMHKIKDPADWEVCAGEVRRAP